MRKFTPLEIAQKKWELEGLQACIIEDLHQQMARLLPTRTHHDHDDTLHSMIMPLRMEYNGSSTIVSTGAGYCSTRLVQTNLNTNEMHAVNLSDSEMDTLCALWLLYKREKLSEE